MVQETRPGTAHSALNDRAPIPQGCYLVDSSLTNGTVSRGRSVLARTKKDLKGVSDMAVDYYRRQAK